MSETIRQANDLPASEFISMLHSAVLHFANGTEQQDDRTPVIVKRERNGARRKDS